VVVGTRRTHSATGSPSSYCARDQPCFHHVDSLRLLLSLPIAIYGSQKDQDWLGICTSRHIYLILQRGAFGCLDFIY
jgi:hypothetical protein